jgi:hypothetical protein
LLGAWNPGANRSLIAFAGWANLAHAGVMAVQECLHVIKPQELFGIVVFGIVGVALIALIPGKAARELVTAAGD